VAPTLDVLLQAFFTIPISSSHHKQTFCPTLLASRTIARGHNSSRCRARYSSCSPPWLFPLHPWPPSMSTRIEAPTTTLSSSILEIETLVTGFTAPIQSRNSLVFPNWPFSLQREQQIHPRPHYALCLPMTNALKASTPNVQSHSPHAHLGSLKNVSLGVVLHLTTTSKSKT